MDKLANEFHLDPTKIIPGTCFVCGNACDTRWIAHEQCCICYYDFKTAFFKDEQATKMLKMLWMEFETKQPKSADKQEPFRECQT